MLSPSARSAPMATMFAPITCKSEKAPRTAEAALMTSSTIAVFDGRVQGFRKMVLDRVQPFSCGIRETLGVNEIAAEFERN
jgi:hypothetical protein